uniref:Uncharacterized protein n=1 Tax=Chromera velia CCMP2878 TaxID=1169474 RepID=A0A0G4I0K3_9ALVE|eukprot:Cvel_9934.t1-p1 / transcript=Cvel_9934.t1 / gene=Cvel_9934 / organism=Chromera_velia_CCMP2878 / gene_product=hypothetical protein / transcript_product=hypothetical protein / location=Cvel_scaffold587:46769-47985(-) / protein_length=361 / sequence_SO=supercontig / SO=protein_coding / is_pseudo=false
MQKAKRSASQSSTLSVQSYDDIEGLLINLGVVAALLLSFVVATWVALRPEDFDRGSFRAYFSAPRSKGGGFADFVNTTLNEIAGFPWELDMGNGQVYNIADGLASWKEKGESLRGSLDSMTYRRYFKEIQVIFPVIIEYFPLYKFRAWEALNAPEGLPGFLPRDEAEWEFTHPYGFQALGCFAFLLLSLSLIDSIVLYITLTASKAREDSEVVAEWWKLGRIAMWFGYLLLVVGLVAFVFQVSVSVQMTGNTHAMFFFIMTHWNYFIFIPLAMGIFIFGLVTLTKLNRKCCFRRKDDLSEVVALDEDVGEEQHEYQQEQEEEGEEKPNSAERERKGHLLRRPSVVRQETEQSNCAATIAWP